MAVSRFKRAASLRRQRYTPAPIGFDEAAFDKRAEIAREQMRKIDLMPPEFRELVHEYGVKVRGMMREGKTPEQIRKAFVRG